MMGCIRHRFGRILTAGDERGVAVCPADAAVTKAWVRRTPALAAVVIAAFASISDVAAPHAHATPIDNIRGAVNDLRETACRPMNYSRDLEIGAYVFIRGGGARDGNDYLGQINAVKETDDPTAAATDDLLTNYGYNITNCNWTDFGVGFFRDDAREETTVSYVLGMPEDPHSLPRVKSDTPLYPQPNNRGGQRPYGNVLKGTRVHVLERRDGYAHIQFFVMTHQVNGWVVSGVLTEY